MDGTGIKALLFDVFGTVVDWRSSVIREATAFGLANGITADWEAFADGWRGKYQPFMDQGAQPARCRGPTWTGCIASPWRNCSTNSGSGAYPRLPRRS